MSETSGFEATVPAGADFPHTPAYVNVPAGATRGVVVIHEIYGRQPEIDRVVDRFAAHGYAAIAPDLFRAPSMLTCVRRTMQALRTGEGPAVSQARAVRRWLCDRAQLDEAKVGIIGFCFGGGFALGVGRGWGAISTNYGQLPFSDEVLRGLGPTIGCFGGRDLAFRDKGAELERRLHAAGVEVEAHTFPEVGHSFLTDGEHPIAWFFLRPILRFGYNPAVAEEAWRRIFAFFDRHLA